MLITKEKKKKKIAIITTTKINTEKFISTYTDITVQEILEIRHSQFEILTDNLTLVLKHISLYKFVMLNGREMHRFVPEYRKVLLKFSLFGCGTCKLFDVADLKP